MIALIGIKDNILRNKDIKEFLNSSLNKKRKEKAEETNFK